MIIIQSPTIQVIYRASSKTLDPGINLEANWKLISPISVTMHPHLEPPGIFLELSSHLLKGYILLRTKGKKAPCPFSFALRPR